MSLALVDDLTPDSSRSGTHPGVPPRRELGGVLAELGDRISTGALALDRTLPVLEPLIPLFPDRGLVRGRVVSCRGGPSCSVVPLLLASRAVHDGAWLAVVDVDTVGLDAADELGVPIERVVRISTTSTSTWIDVMGAAVDGFDLVVTTVPAELSGDDRLTRRLAASVRKLAARVQQRGAVVVALGAPGVLGVDVEIGIARSSWSGLGEGWGHLRERSLELVSTGRRVAGSRRCVIELAAEGDVVRVSTGARNDTTETLDGVDTSDAPERRRAELDPEEVLVAEMRSSIAASGTAPDGSATIGRAG